MRRRLFTVCSALSLVLFVTTAFLWLAYAVEQKLYIRLHGGSVRLGPYVEITVGHEVAGRPHAVYGLKIEHPWPRVTGPAYLTSEYMAWERQFRRRDRQLEVLGVRYWRWAIIRIYPRDRTEFRGYQYGVQLPYWLVGAVTAVLPAWWFARWQWRRRRSTRALCPACGYDLRATRNRCPECGSAVADRLQRTSTAPRL